MTITLSKTLMILLVCFTFIGQTMATTVMPYQMMNMMEMSTQEPMQDMSMMNHSHHNMVSISSEANAGTDNAEAPTKDCCTKNCKCFTSGCSSMAAFTTYIVNEPVVDLSPKIFTYSPLVQNQQSTSLYRPPILS